MSLPAASHSIAVRCSDARTCASPPWNRSPSCRRPSHCSTACAGVAISKRWTMISIAGVPRHAWLNMPRASGSTLQSIPRCLLHARCDIREAQRTVRIRTLYRASAHADSGCGGGGDCVARWGDYSRGAGCKARAMTHPTLAPCPVRRQPYVSSAAGAAGRLQHSPTHATGVAPVLSIDMRAHISCDRPG